MSPQAPFIRRAQLEAYLGARLGGTKLLLIGEALSYRGGKFTGIPMMSERIVLGRTAVDPGAVAKAAFQRTSKAALNANGFTEPTASIVWGRLLDSGVDPASVCIWNIYPWHPYAPAKGKLSNRTPDEAELAFGLPIADQLIRLLKPSKLIAIGEKSYGTLLPARPGLFKVRHPANGGAGQFRQQFGKLVA